MNVGIDVSAAAYGTGVSDYTIGLVNNLPKKLITPFGFSWRRGGDIKKAIPSAQVFPIPPTAMHWVWNKFHTLPVETFVKNIDIYHSSDWTQGPARAKKVTTVHDLSPFLYPEELDPQIVAVHTARMKWVVKECDKIICVSHNTANDLQKLFKIPSERIEVIYEGLPDRFRLAPQKSPFIDYVVTIGARQPRKNIARLVNAFTTFKSKYSLPSKLIIIGEKPDNAINYDSVIYTGYISDQELVNIVASAKVFVYPSLYEGFGLPILIAYYHQVPVTVSDSSAFPEVAGKAAIYFNPLNEEDIIKGVVEAITSHKKLTALGQQQLSSYDLRTMVSQTAEAYQSVL